MRMILVRTTYSLISTGGILLLDDNFFAYTLEDQVRMGPKVPGETAIPAGRYKVTLSMSPHFRKVLPELHEVPGFAGVRIHGGNTAADTEGCILVARDRVGPDTIQGSMSQTLVSILANAGGDHEIDVLNAWRER